MLEFYLKRLLVKVACWFIPTKATRLAFRSKMRFGKELVELERVDGYVPDSVLESMARTHPRDFLQGYKAQLCPMPLSEILAHRQDSILPPPR